VSRAGGDRSVVQISRPGASGISNALWPSRVRRSIATGRIAQQRRLLTLKRIWWATRSRRVMPHLRFFYHLLLFVLLVGAILLGVLVFQYWMLLLLLALAWSVIIMLMTRLLCDKIYDMLVLRRGRKQASTPYKRRTAAATHFPETPMPPTPLIRVLETIDLSRVDVESLMAEIDEARSTEQEESGEEGT
jgi:hypothetical protein